VPVHVAFCGSTRDAARFGAPASCVEYQHGEPYRACVLRVCRGYENTTVKTLDTSMCSDGLTVKLFPLWRLGPGCR
jgi:hypothetical protein